MDLETALTYSLETDSEKRRIGEHCIQLLERTPASLVATTTYAIDKTKPGGQRQLAALISKRLVKAFWANIDGPSQVQTCFSNIV
jgi:hypothetical protein